jgi:hypothetical protein
MKISTILHSPKRAAAVAAVAGLLFAAGGTVGTAFGSGGAPADTTSNGRDVPGTAASAADADTFYHYLGTLTPADRAQTIIAFNPNVRGALEAIIAGEVAAANTH